MRVLIAVDESQRIADQARAVQALARDTPAAQVFVLHVLAPGEGGNTEEAQERLAAERRSAIEAALDAVGLQATVIIETRAPFERVYQHVIAVARRQQVAAIVVASKRVGRLIDVVLGGVAQELLRHSPVAVLVVRPGTPPR